MSQLVFEAVACPSIAITAHTAETKSQSIANAMSRNKIHCEKLIREMKKVKHSFRTTLRSLENTAVQRANNTRQQRGGYMFETAHGQTLQTDADIKGIYGKAEIPASTEKGSADVVFREVKIPGEVHEVEMSGKVCKNAKASAYAQSNPSYGDQQRIIPSDQLKEGRDALIQRARRETLRGRPHAAAQQRKTAALLDDRIRTPEGAESTPLTRKQALELADSVKVDETGKPVVDVKKIKKVLDESGETEKVNRAIEERKHKIQKLQDANAAARKKRIFGEIAGAGKVAAIGALTAGGVTAATIITQNGLSAESLQTAMIEGGKSSAEGGLVSLASYGVTRTAGVAVSNAAGNAVQNAGISLTANISAALNIGVLGVLTTASMSAYTFIKRKISGETTAQALKQTAKSAALSIGITAAAAVTTACFGVTAGTAVSAAIGIGTIFYALFKSRLHKQKTSRYSKWDYTYAT